MEWTESGYYGGIVARRGPVELRVNGDDGRFWPRASIDTRTAGHRVHIVRLGDVAPTVEEAKAAAGRLADEVTAELVRLADAVPDMARQADPETTIP